MTRPSGCVAVSAHTHRKFRKIVPLGLVGEDPWHRLLLAPHLRPSR
jgi:hypothetical protein